MNAIPSSTPPRNAARYRVLLAPTLLALSSLAAAATAPAANEHLITAVLKLREIDFVYHSTLAQYSCEALQTRVSSVMRALGARDDVDVRVSGCAMIPGQADTIDSHDIRRNSSDRWNASVTMNPGDNRGMQREQSAHVQIRALLPVEATPEALADAEKEKSRRELVARVTGNPNAAMNETMMFPAKRTQVVLSRKTIGIEPVECELLDQMSMGVLRRLNMRVIGGGPNCGRNEVSRIPIQMTVETLMPVLYKGPQIELGPAATDPDPSAPAPAEAAPSETQPAESGSSEAPTDSPPQ